MKKQRTFKTNKCQFASHVIGDLYKCKYKRKCEFKIFAGVEYYYCSLKLYPVGRLLYPSREYKTDKTIQRGSDPADRSKLEKEVE